MQPHADIHPPSTTAPRGVGNPCKGLEKGESELEALFGFAPFPVFVVEPCSGRFHFVNPEARRLLGYDCREFARLTLSEVFPNAELPRLLARRAGPLPSADRLGEELSAIRKDGVVLRVRLTPYRAWVGNRAHWICVAREAIPNGVVERERRLAAAVFEHAKDGIMITDGNLRVERVNDAFCRMLGCSPEEAVGRRPRELLRPEYDRWVLHRDPWSTLEDGAVWQGEVVARRKEGEPFPARLRIHGIRIGDTASPHGITIVSDLSGSREAEHRINRLAYYDVLTNLPNRLLFNEHLRRSLARAQERKARLALLFVDLDRFKDINDTLGPASGNGLLRIMADRLRHSVREQDFVARMGGDEFAIVLEGVRDDQSVAAIGEKLLEALARPTRLGETEMVIGGSIGISLFPDHARDADTLLRNADTAMYQAKEHGRNLCRFYTSELGRITSDRFHIERELRKALEENHLEIHYQAQARATDGSILGVEALLRWHHPEHGWIPPGRFIPIAEESGLIVELGRWVLHRACADARAWSLNEAPGLRVAVNLSGKQVIDPTTVAVVADVLQTTGLPPELLELEITEGFVIKNPEQGIETLNGLKALGVSLSMDDFGTGYSSLSYLHRFPVDRLKIDQSFVRGLPGDRYSETIATSILAIAHALDMEVVGEGVETVEQLAFLREKGCDEIQGYYLSRPCPVDQFFALHRRLERLNPPTRERDGWAIIHNLKSVETS